MSDAILELTHNLTVAEARQLVQDMITDLGGRTKAVRVEIQAQVPETPNVIAGKLNFKLFGDVRVTVKMFDNLTVISAEIPLLLRVFIDLAATAICREVRARIQEVGGTYVGSALKTHGAAAVE